MVEKIKKVLFHYGFHAIVHGDYTSEFNFLKGREEGGRSKIFGSGGGIIPEVEGGKAYMVEAVARIFKEKFAEARAGERRDIREALLASGMNPQELQQRLTAGGMAPQVAASIAGLAV